MQQSKSTETTVTLSSLVAPPNAKDPITPNYVVVDYKGIAGPSQTCTIHMKNDGPISFAFAQDVSPNWVFVNAIFASDDDGELYGVELSKDKRSMTFSDSYTKYQRNFGFRLQLSDGTNTFETPDPEVKNNGPR